MHNIRNDMLFGAIPRVASRRVQNTFHRYLMFSTFPLRVNEKEQLTRQEYCQQTRLAQSDS
jgi:hypothetical protein